MLCTRTALALLPLAFVAPNLPQEKSKTLPIEAWRTPGKEHESIVAGAGEWEGTLTMFGEEDMPPIAVKQTVEAIGPFWTQTRFTGDFMGMPYVGTGCVGYDPSAKKYVGTWIDNTWSAFALMEGERDADGKLVMRWKAPDETTGETVLHRTETVTTADSSVMTFYRGEGKGVKSMVIDMKRKK